MGLVPDNKKWLRSSYLLETYFEKMNDS